MTREEYIKDIFEFFPKASELYEDTAGHVWICKETAVKQSEGGKCNIIKRKDIFKTVNNETEN